MNKRQGTTLQMCLWAIMAAMVFVVNYLRIPFMGTSLHLTNGLCAVAGLLFGPAGGFVSAGLGSMLFDLMGGYGAECLITLVSKGAIGLLAGLIGYKAAHRDLRKTGNLCMIVLAGAVGALTYVALYMLKTYIFGLTVNGLDVEGTLVKMGTKLPGSLLNAAFACIVCPVLYCAVKPALRHIRM